MRKLLKERSEKIKSNFVFIVTPNLISIIVFTLQSAGRIYQNNFVKSTQLNRG